MKKSRKYLIIFFSLVTALIIFGVIIKTNVSSNDKFTVESIDLNLRKNAKISKRISEINIDNGVFLLNIDDKETYLILNGSNVNLKGEAPYFSNVSISSKEDTISIYVNEENKKYFLGEYPNNKLVYKITNDKDSKYMKIFRNGEESYFDSIIL
jgi:hypothetical protein